MLWFIIIPSILFIGLWAYFQWDDQAVPGSNFVASLFYGLFVGGILALIANGIVTGTQGKHWVVSGTENLQSIRTSQDTHGSFFLGSGSFESEPAYYFFVKTSDGGYIEKHVPADEAKVFESNMTPHVEYLEKRNLSKNTDWNIFAGNNDGWNYYYNFYVPPGSVIQTYKLTP